MKRFTPVEIVDYFHTFSDKSRRGQFSPIEYMALCKGFSELFKTCAAEHSCKKGDICSESPEVGVICDEILYGKKDSCKSKISRIEKQIYLLNHPEEAFSKENMKRKDNIASRLKHVVNVHSLESKSIASKQNTDSIYDSIDRALKSSYEDVQKAKTKEEIYA